MADNALSGSGGTKSESNWTDIAADATWMSNWHHMFAKMKPRLITAPFVDSAEPPNTLNDSGKYHYNESINSISEHCDKVAKRSTRMFTLLLIGLGVFVVVAAAVPIMIIVSKANEAEFHRSCSTEGKGTGCKTSHAVCTDGTCICPAGRFHATEGDSCDSISCGKPPSVKHGTRIDEPTGTGYLDTFTMKCDKGYELLGGETSLITCLVHDTWGKIPSCDPIECPQYQLPKNARILNGSTTGHKFTDVLVVNCTNGYKLPEGVQNFVTCQANKTWSTSPSCSECGPYNKPNNSNFIEPENTSVGAVINISCDIGHVLIGESVVTCGKDGSWSKSPTCENVNCGAYNGPSNSIFKTPTLNTYGTEINITCDTGYILNGDTIVTCDENGIWSNKTFCEIVDCEAPNAVTDSQQTEISGTTYNESLTIECKTGYLINGPDEIFCQADGKWSEAPTCTIVECGAVYSPENGAPEAVMGTTFDDTATVVCNDGFNLVGNALISCLATGNWSDFPLCIKIDCGNLIPSNNSKLIPDSDEFIIKCDDGYMLIGSDRITCQQDGNWSVNGSCDRVKCPSFIAPENGHVPEPSNGSAFDTLTVSCRTGFVISGKETNKEIITCISDGKWSSSPTCEPVDCGPFQEVVNGSFDASIITTYGSVIYVTCDTGYNMTGNSNVSCNEDGIWRTIPTCNVVDCGPFEAPNNSALSDSVRTTFESEITITCNVGYKMIGLDTVICDENGKWSSSPICNKIDCGSFATPTNGIVNDNEPTTYGTNLTIDCINGYALIGAATVTCNEDGSWSKSPICEVVNCGEYTRSGNSVYETPAITTVGTEINITCDNGYKLSGDPIVTCDENGIWSNKTFCEIVDCEVPNAVSDSQQTEISGTTYNESITIECKTGYLINGPDEIFCQADGKWSETPTCTIVECGAVYPPENGAPEAVMGTTFDDTATVVCNDGFNLVGNALISCLATGNWSDLPLCIKTNCGNIVPPDNSKLIPDSDAFIIKCDDGYILIGSDRITCQQDGNWSVNGSCDRVKCPSFPALEDGHVPEPSNGSAFDTLTVSCRAGFVISGKETNKEIITCLSDGKWSSSPSCELVDCGPFQEVVNGSFDASITTTYGSVIYVTCDTGYTIAGNSNVSCEDHGMWSNIPTCNVVDCGPYEAPSNSTLNDSVKTTFESEITITCDVGYTILGSDTVICDGTGKWSRSPTCNIIDCGPFTTPTNGIMDDSEPTTYGTNLTIKCTNGYNRIGAATVTCAKDGVWSNGLICEIMNCGVIGQITANGQIPDEYNKTFGSAVIVTCQTGFELNGNETIVCTDEGIWENQPTCEIVNCGDPAAIENGDFVTVGNTTYGSEIDVECDKGFEINGENKMHCTDHGKWSEPPTCEIVTCGGYTIPENTKITSTNGTTYGSVITLACVDDFHLVDENESMVKCDEDGTWKGSSDGEEPVCATIGSVSFSSRCYVFKRSSIGVVTCNVSNAAHWATIHIMNKESTPIAIVNQSNGEFTTMTKFDSLSIGSESEFSGSHVTLVVQFGSVADGDEGQYSCRAALDYAPVDGTRYKVATTFISVEANQNKPSLAVPSTVISTNTNIAIVCTGEAGLVDEGKPEADLSLHVKFKNSDVFTTITSDLYNITTGTECPVQIKLDANVLVDSTWDNAIFKCVLTTAANDELVSETGTIFVESGTEAYYGKYDITITVTNLEHDVAMADPTTVAFISTSNSFCEQMASSYAKSSLRDSYEGCIVNTLESGTIVIGFTLVFAFDGLILLPISSVQDVLTADENTNENGETFFTVGQYMFNLFALKMDVITKEESPVEKDIYFSDLVMSAYIGEELTIQCNVKNTNGLSKISLLRGDKKDAVSTIPSSGDEDLIDGIKTITGESSIADTLGTLKVQITAASCADKGKYFCQAVGTHGSKESVSTITIKRHPEVPRLDVTIDVIENKYQWASFPTTCVGEVGYPAKDRRLVLESNLNGNFVELNNNFTKYESEIDEDLCSTTGTFKYANDKVYTMDWNNTLLRCSPKEGTEVDLTHSVTKVVYVVPASICDGASSNTDTVEHPYECSSYLTCSGTAIKPYQVCSITDCYVNYACRSCAHVNKCKPEYTTPPTAALHTTPQPGTPWLQCTNKTQSAPVGDSVQFICTLHDIDKVTSIKLNKGADKELHSEDNDNGIVGTIEVSSDVTMEIEIADSRIVVTMANVKCDSEGVYVLTINGEAEDKMNLRIVSNHSSPKINLPLAIYKNELTQILCDANVGRDENGEQTTTLYMEVKYETDVAFTVLSEGVVKEQSFDDAKCALADALTLSFYAETKWDNADVRCSLKDEAITTVMSTDEHKLNVLESNRINFGETFISKNIGESVTISCNVENIAGLSKVSVTRGKDKSKVSTITRTSQEPDSISGIATITNESFINEAVGTLKVRIASTICGDKGHYFCKAEGDDVSVETRSTLSLNRSPGMPELNLPLKLVADEKTKYDGDYLKCSADVGFPEGSVKLKYFSVAVSQFRDFKDANIGDKYAIHTTEGDCKIIKGDAYHFIPFSRVWNNTRFRCDVFDEDLNLSGKSPEQTLQLIENNCFSDGDGFYFHPINCHNYIRCHSQGTLDVLSCFDKCPASPNKTTVECANDGCKLC